MPDIAVQRFLLRRVMSLPPAALRAMSGGGVVQRGGRVLDPRMQYLWKTWRRAGASAGISPEEARKSWAELVATVGPEPLRNVTGESITLDGPAGAIPARLHRPATTAAEAPIVVYLHEGGWIAGGLAESEGVASRLAAAAGAVVLTPAYRLAPEHRFPAAYEDALAAVRWARENGHLHGGAPGAVSVAGVSNGAGMAAAVCIELKRTGEPQPHRQVLVCPILDGAETGRSMHDHADAWPMSVMRLRWLLRHYLTPDVDANDPRLSPLRTEDLSGLAPAVIAAAGFDPLSDQADLYARRLRTAGVPVSFRLFDTLPHVFPQFSGVVPEAAEAWRTIGRMLRG